MPTIKQLIAEIQLAPELNDRQKVVIKKLIEEADERLKLKSPKKAKKLSNSKNLATLPEWEEKRGKRLSKYDVGAWLDYRVMSEKMIEVMVEEFRNDMIAKGRQYANFAAAFAVYLRKGYLSKTYDMCLAVNNKSDAGTTIHTKGVAL